MKRKISAILAADIAGYSRLVAEDEEETLRRLAKYRDTFADLVSRSGGRIFNTAGDAILAEFGSAVDAVRCAIDVQETLRARDLAYPPSRRMAFRIGITIGDVVERDGDLLGDAVNVAARLEGLAVPGGICISRSTYEQVASKVSIKFVDIGLQQVKNIPNPVHVYRVGEAPDASAGQQGATTTDKRGTKRASVVLLGAAAIAAGLVVGIIYRSALFGNPDVPRKGVAPSLENPLTAAPTPAQEEPARPSPEAPKSTGKAPSEKSTASVPLTTAEERELRPKMAFSECATCPEMVVVPAGEFLMGSPDTESGRLKFEGPVHKVVIAARMAVGRYAITRDQFKAFVDATGYGYGKSCYAQSAAGWVDKIDHSFLSPPGFIQDGNHPAVCVSWKDANAYVSWLSNLTQKPYRLLTEAEREYIARAGTQTPYWWGTTVGPEQANFDTQPRPDPSPGATTSPAWRIEAKPDEPSVGPRVIEPGVASGRTVPVDWGRPNAWGLFQVHGNVAEWVQDCWNPDYTRTPADGSAARSGNCSMRVMRGGAWSSWPEDLRAAFREMGDEGEHYFSVGFRVARDLSK